MKIYEKLDTTAKISDNSEIICIGAFDGVHLAHQELFKKTRDLNKQFDIVTFDVLPKIYFNDSLKPLVSKNERSKIFETFSPKNLIYLNFEQFNKISSTDFCKFLDENLGIKRIVVGKDFKFGKNRSGDINSLIDSFGEDNIFLLEDYLIKSGSDHCNVCLYKFPEPKKLQCTYYRSFGVSLFKCFVIYIVAGFIGQIIYYWASQKNIVLLAPWTDIFALSSIVVICVIVFLYAFIKRYLITL